jgi:hypothetical protein
MQDALPPQRLQDLGEISRRDLRRLSDLVVGPRVRSVLTEMRHGAEGIFHCLGKHAKPYLKEKVDIDIQNADDILG